MGKGFRKRENGGEMYYCDMGKNARIICFLFRNFNRQSTFPSTSQDLLSMCLFVLFLPKVKPNWKKLIRKDGIKSRHVAWAQLLWRSFGVMGFVCQHCGCLMRLRAIAIYPPATTKILRGLGVNLHGLGFTGPP